MTVVNMEHPEAGSAMDATRAPQASFSSVGELQAAHGALVVGMPDAGPTVSEIASIKAFLTSVAASGAVLYTPEDRKVAHGIIAYWTATLYSTVRSDLQAGPIGASVSNLNWLGDIRLADFARKAVDDVITAAEASITGMTPVEQELVPKILLRLTRLVTRESPDDFLPPKDLQAPAEEPNVSTSSAAAMDSARLAGGDRLAPDPRRFEAIVVDRTELNLLGDSGAVNSVIAKLIAAGALRQISPQSDQRAQFSLGFDSLTRKWRRLAALLEQRARFRDAVRYWSRCGRDDAALIRGPLLGQALNYRDLDALEQQFIEASRRGEVRRSHRFKGAAIALGVVALIAALGWRSAHKAEGDAHNAEMNAKKALLDLGTSNSELKKTNIDLSQAKAALEQDQAARRTRQQLADTSLLLRTVLEVLFAPNEAEGVIAFRRWEGVAASLAPNPIFAVPLAQSREILGKAPDPNRPDDLSQLQPALGLARQLHNQLMASDDRVAVDALTSARSVAYGTAEFCAEQICTRLEKHQPFSDAEPFVREFWVLYWGEMAIVEGPAVESAMVEFGRKLQDVRRDVQPAPDVSRLLQEIQKSKNSAIPFSVITLLAARQALSEQYFQVKSAAAAQTVTLSEKDLVRIGQELNKGASEADAAALREILDKRLRPALHKELTAKIGQNTAAPTAL